MRTNLTLIFIAFTFAIATLLTSVSAKTAEEHRPFSEMNGKCDHYRLDIKKELARWKSDAVLISAGKTVAQLPQIEIGKKVRLQLGSEADAQLLLPPEKKFKSGESRFAGMVETKFDKKGTYRVSMSAKVWLDVIDKVEDIGSGQGAGKGPGKQVPALRFEMQTRCTEIFKVVEFDLEQNKPYILQISSSPSATVDLLLSRIESLNSIRIRQPSAGAWSISILNENQLYLIGLGANFSDQ